LVPSPWSVPWHNPVSELYSHFRQPQVFGFCSNMHCQLWDLYIDRSKWCPISWLYHRWTPIKV
jgi:hypothetical protein